MKIKITQKHLEEMKKKLNERMYRIQKAFREEQEHNMACWEESEYLNSISGNDIVCELDRTYRLCDDIDWYIENLKDEGIEVNRDAWFEEWDFSSTVDDTQFDKYYMLPIEQKENISSNKMKFNKFIRIYRTDVEKMKFQIERRMANVWDIYYLHKDYEEYYMEKYPEEYYGEYLSANEVWVEIGRTNYLCNKADDLLEDDNFDFIWVDADEWFDKWHFDERIEDGLIDEYYMFPDSYEVDEIFEKMKSEYKYSMTDLFGFFRFCTVNKDTAIA